MCTFLSYLIHLIPECCGTQVEQGMEGTRWDKAAMFLHAALYISAMVACELPGNSPVSIPHWDWTQLIRLCSKCFYLLSHLFCLNLVKCVENTACHFWAQYTSAPKRHEDGWSSGNKQVYLVWKRYCNQIRKEVLIFFIEYIDIYHALLHGFVLELLRIKIIS